MLKCAGRFILIKMRYLDFEDAFSSDRMSKYVTACNGDTRKAMTLYRYNLQLSQELFTVVSCFEVTLRNRIAHHEPVCFNKTTGAIDTSYALTMYARIMTLFQWIGIDSGSLLFGLDHVGQVCNKIMCL